MTDKLIEKIKKVLAADFKEQAAETGEYFFCADDTFSQLDGEFDLCNAAFAALTAIKEDYHLVPKGDLASIVKSPEWVETAEADGVIYDDRGCYEIDENNGCFYLSISGFDQDEYRSLDEAKKAAQSHRNAYVLSLLNIGEE